MVASLFIVDVVKGTGEAPPIPRFGEELSMAHTISDELQARQRRAAVFLGV
jgi:hypothetical protein